jgi:hypothetical protein
VGLKVQAYLLQVNTMRKSNVKWQRRWQGRKHTWDFIILVFSAIKK